MVEGILTWFIAALVCTALIAILVQLRRIARRQRRIIKKIEELPQQRLFHDINEFRQYAAFSQLERLLSPRQPLPPMRDWAISPDFALLLVRLIQEHRPARIVEFGSGSSTLVCAYCLQQLGGGQIISVDHDPDFAQRTRNDLGRHGLAEWADVRVAGLEQSAYTDTNGQPIVWYEAQVVDLLPEGIDLVIVDGPPSIGCGLARYPALPTIARKLAPGAIVVLDDAGRAEETAVYKRWQADFPDGEVTYERTEKGAAILSL